MNTETNNHRFNKSEYKKQYSTKNRDKINEYQRNYYKSKKEKVDLEKKEVCEEKQKQEDYMEKLYNKMIALEKQLSQMEVTLYAQTKTSEEKTSNSHHKEERYENGKAPRQTLQEIQKLQTKNKIVVKSQTQEPETIEKLPAEHKKLYEAFKKQQAKTQQAPSTTTTDYESESESEESDSEFEIDADGNII
jgi:hypothetical protein